MHKDNVTPPNVSRLIDIIKNDEYVYIQTHNFPDDDAIASAYGLQNLLRQLKLASRLVYDGEIERESLVRMIKKMNIDIRRASEYRMKASDKIIVVDGCKGNKNVTDLIGEEVAVIDHHQTESPHDVRYSDIRPDRGACCTIIHSYYEDLQLDVPGNVATAMMIGINMDTALLTRGVSQADIRAYASLYPLADMTLVNSVLRNQVQTHDLTFYKKALERLKINKTFAYCYFPDGCKQNLLGILGDFFLSLQEVEFVALAANNDEKINFSLRSERADWNASAIIQNVLRGIGFGGGHAAMAGGMIADKSLFDEQEIYRRLIEALGIQAP